MLNSDLYRYDAFISLSQHDRAWVQQGLLP